MIQRMAVGMLLCWTCTAGAQAKLKLALPGFSGVGVSQEFLRFASEHFAQELGNEGLSVITEREISTLLGLERQRQLLGCSENSVSCAAELAGALGVDATVVGDIGKFENVYRVNVKI